MCLNTSSLHERVGTINFSWLVHPICLSHKCNFSQVTSKKDQAQYWIQNEKPYHDVSVPEFVLNFRKFHMGQSLKKQLSVPFNKRKIHKSALVFSDQSVSTSELLKTSFSKEWLLMQRNSFIYVFKIVQVPRSKITLNGEVLSYLFIDVILCLPFF